LEVVVDDTKENIVDSIRYRPIKSEYIYSPTKSIKLEEGYKMISLDNNMRAFQCDICDKIFKDKTKLKLHREIHTDQRNVICQVLNSFTFILLDLLIKIHTYSNAGKDSRL
jgi:hypothetical protein